MPKYEYCPECGLLMEYRFKIDGEYEYRCNPCGLAVLIPAD